MGGAQQPGRYPVPFFEQLGERCQQIEAVAMDMNTAFDLEVKQHCPQAEVVYDLFHVVARYGRRWWTGCGVETGECTESDKPARKVVKVRVGCCYVIRAKLSEKQDVKLQELLAAESTAGDGVRAERGVEGHLVCAER